MSDIGSLLAPEAIVLDGVAADKAEAITLVGELLIGVGAVGPANLEAMHEREASVSTYLGEGVAIPHGTGAAKSAVVRDALAYVRFPDGVDWDGEKATLAIGIAAVGDGHLEILAELADILLDPDRAQALREATTVLEVLRMLAPGSQPDGVSPDADTAEGE